MLFIIGSYNSRGLGQGRMDYICEICTKVDFLFIQEHWLIPQNLGILLSIPDFSCHGTSAMDTTEVLIGRPHGGCSILWKSSLKCKVTPVDCCSPRICAVLVEMSNSSMLLINFYMPVDTRHDRENDEVFRDVLAEASALVMRFGVDHVIYGGDFNTDFTRRASLHTASLNRFLVDEDLVEPPGSAIDYSYENVVTGDRSFIDHFLITDNLRDRVNSYYCAHDGHNLSDHSPIFIELDLAVDSIVSVPVDREPRLR